jgi:acetyl-CoA C-acetyltransferase
MGDWKMTDTMIVDGLWDVYNQYHMGITAENVAKAYGISRAAQDALALGSQQKGRRRAGCRQVQGRDRCRQHPAEEGRSGGLRRRTSSSTQDQRRSPGRPAPGLRQGRRVTAGNASGLNDGAAAVVVMTAKKAARWA